ncbi:hypothetical protein YC2023_121634 [Brassica napus]
MKTIQLICIVFVVLLSSFPTTIKSKKLADTCFESLAYCMNLIPRDKKYWEKDCCNVRAKRDQAATKQCSCIIANNHQKYVDLVKLFQACGLGNTWGIVTVHRDVERFTASSLTGMNLVVSSGPKRTITQAVRKTKILISFNAKRKGVYAREEKPWRRGFRNFPLHTNGQRY